MLPGRHYLVIAAGDVVAGGNNARITRFIGPAMLPVSYVVISCYAGNMKHACCVGVRLGDARHSLRAINAPQHREQRTRILAAGLGSSNAGGFRIQQYLCYQPIVSQPVRGMKQNNAYRIAFSTIFVWSYHPRKRSHSSAPAGDVNHVARCVVIAWRAGTPYDWYMVIRLSMTAADGISSVLLVIWTRQPCAFVTACLFLYAHTAGQGACQRTMLRVSRSGGRHAHITLMRLPWR